ncbi:MULTISPECIES: hypothetical protein [unclassified Rhizobium]|jgi:hypothetical protein|uniref:hypothetical protein n=1 Tax=unclassified Rhizobium TaxID=2613769 RepID=UPI000A462743|nr:MULTISPECIES: hypothetical protein [unclassified Rhizobium]
MPRSREEKAARSDLLDIRSEAFATLDRRTPAAKQRDQELEMGIGKLIEEVAGAVAADEAVEAVDPNAGFITKAAAAVAGFEGVNKLTDVLKEKEQEPAADNSGDQNG